MRLRAEATATVVAVDELIDNALLRTLEPAIAAIDRLLESARVVADEHGEPDGFDGLDRRGLVDRLLPSEWLLASEAPDEFVRRFERAELGYLRLNTVRQRRPHTSLVLFDAGPDQLGRPRVAQLATLVVLDRRARRMGSSLRWGVLGQRGRYDAGSDRSLRQFLEARTFESWRDLPVDAFVDECLVVSRRSGPPFASQQLELTEDGDVVVADLIDHRSQLSRRVRIPMPAPEDGVRLLRNPTGTRTGDVKFPNERGPTSNLVFDQRGNKLLARIEPHRLAIYPVPNSTNDKAGRTRYVATSPTDGVIAAAGRVKKSVLTVNIVDDGRSVVVRNFGGNVTAPTGTYPVQNGPVPVPAAEDALGRVTWTDGTLRVHLEGLRLTQSAGAYRADRADGSLRWGRPGFDISATPLDGAWVVRAGGQEWRYDAGPVFGVFPRWSSAGGQHHKEARLMTLAPDGLALIAVGPSGDHEILYAAGERILDAVSHDGIGVYAVRTASGRVVVRSWMSGETLLEVVPG